MIRTLLALLLLAGPHAEAAPLDTKALDKHIGDTLKAWAVPGVAVVVVTPEETLYLKGHGVRERRGPAITPDTTFPLASCSKAFTATLTGLLVDAGVVAWDDPVRKHLKEFKLADPAADALVTLRDLLSHRTGVEGHDLLWYRAPWNQAEAIRRVGHLPLTRPFRGDMQYQSIMYMAVGHALERATKQPWDTLLRERLLKPLGMNATTTTTTAAFKQADRATGYRQTTKGELEAVPWYAIPEANAAGSINSTPRDLATWLRFQLRGGLHDEDRLLSEEALRETRTPQIVVRREPRDPLSPDSMIVSYGLGWVVQDYRGQLLVQHAGSIDGFRVHFAFLPNHGVAWAVLCNREGTRLNLALSNHLADTLAGLPAKDWNKHYLEMVAEEETALLVKAKQEAQARKPDTTPTVELKEFAGTYRHPAYGEATVQVVDGRLVWKWGSWQLPMEHYHDNIFRLQAEHPRLDRAFARFLVQEGQVRELRLPGMTFTRE